MTSPYDAHVEAVGILKNGLEEYTAQISELHNQIDEKLLGLAVNAIGQETGAVGGNINAAGEKLTEAIGLIQSAIEEADAYLEGWR